MKKNSLRFNIWLYFILFSLIILVSLWVIQVLCLDSYYEWTKNNNVKNVTNKIKNIKNLEDNTDELDLLSFNNDVCIEIFLSDELIYTSGNINHGCMLNNRDNENTLRRVNFIKSKNNSIQYTLKNPFYESNVLVYGIKLNEDSYAFISTSLDPINSTIGVLVSQYKFVTIGVFILSFIIA